MARAVIAKNEALSTVARREAVLAFLVKSRKPMRPIEITSATVVHVYDESSGVNRALQQLVFLGKVRRIEGKRPTDVKYQAIRGAKSTRGRV